MLSKVLKRNYDLLNDNDSLIYFFEEGALSEHDIAQEIVPILRKFDAEGKGKIRVLPDINELNSGVPEMLVKPVLVGKGTNIIGIILPKKVREEVALELVGLGYEIT